MYEKKVSCSAFEIFSKLHDLQIFHSRLFVAPHFFFKKKKGSHASRTYLFDLPCFPKLEWKWKKTIVNISITAIITITKNNLFSISIITVSCFTLQKFILLFFRNIFVKMKKLICKHTLGYWARRGKESWNKWKSRSSK